MLLIFNRDYFTYFHKKKSNFFIKLGLNLCVSRFSWGKVREFVFIFSVATLCIATDITLGSSAIFIIICKYVELIFI